MFKAVASAPSQWKGSAVEPPRDTGKPLVDPAVLRQLRVDLDADEGYCRVFVSNYMEQLPQRVGRLRWALMSSDLEAAMDAVLSLKTSSQMVGASCLVDIACDLETALRLSPDGDSPESTALPRLAGTFLDRIDECSCKTLVRLTAVNAA